MAFNEQLKDYLLKLFGTQPVEPLSTAANLAQAYRARPAGMELITDAGGTPAPTAAPAMPPQMPPVASQPPVQPPQATRPPAMPPAPVQPPMAAPSPAVPAPQQPPTSPVQSVYGSKYDDNARQQLYDSLAEKRRGNAGWEAVANVADLNSRVGGGTPLNAHASMVERNNMAEKTAKGDFEAGRESKLKDATANIALQKAGREDTEYKDANDANSQMSKLAVGFAGQMLGPDKMGKMGWIPGKSTYADVVKILPIIEKQVALETAKTNKEITVGTKDAQFRETQTQKFRDKLNTSQSYKNWQTMSNLNSMAKQSVEKPSPYNDLQLVYATVKALDPTSVVREGEIKLFQGTANLKNQLQGALSTAIKGQPLTPDQKQNVVTLIGQLEKTNKDVFMQHEAPTLNQARRLGLKLNEIDPMLEDNTPAPGGAAPAGWKVLR